MATPIQVGVLLQQQPNTRIRHTDNTTQSTKQWTLEYRPITRLLVHTRLTPDTQETVATWDAFLDLDGDHNRRTQEVCFPTNELVWYFDTEADIEHWFSNEIVSVVLAAFSRYPKLSVSFHIKPLSEINIAENTDSVFWARYGNARSTVIIGEFKRNRIVPDVWQAGNMYSLSQVKLSQELRG